MRIYVCASGRKNAAYHSECKMSLRKYVKKAVNNRENNEGNCPNGSYIFNHLSTPYIDIANVA